MRSTLFTLFFCFSSLHLSGEVIPRSHDRFVFHVIPKCGTHFLHHTFNLLTNKKAVEAGATSIIARQLDEIEKTNQLLRLFCPYNRVAEHLLRSREYKILTVIRDPRDALISLLMYMRQYKGRPPNRDFFRVDDDFDSLSLDKQLSSLMAPKNGGIPYLNYYKQRIGWSLFASDLVITYEELVGEEGKGSKEEQLTMLFQIADTLNLDITTDEILTIAPKLYKSREPVVVEGKIFTRAQIGSWKTFFSDKHKKVFKKQMGLLLIELGYESDLNW